jgi:dTDP-4-amino-4,6-dideoxygalactose transaminase
MPVHLYGQMAPMKDVVDFADSAGLVVIEDAAQAQGSSQHGTGMGGFGLAAATSFYPGKNLGAFGDAGAVVTNSDEIAARVHALRNHGSHVKYEHPELGFNSRLDTLQAVVLLAKLKRLTSWNQQRQRAAQYYDLLLEDVKGVDRPGTARGNVHVWHLYVIQVSDRDSLLEHLNENGIGAGVHYPLPIHLQGAFRHLGHCRDDFPVTEFSADRMLSLPIYPGITPEQQDRVVTCLAEAVRL